MNLESRGKVIFAMIKFKRYPYRVGETYGMDGGLTKRQITMAINKPVRQAKKLQQKAPLLAELITAEPIQDFDAQAEYERRQAAFDADTQDTRDFHARTWREARKRFFELNEATQKAIIEQWEQLTIKASISMPATAVRFAGLVDGMSGDREKRIARYESEYEAYKDALKRQQGEQLNIFGVAS